MSDGRCSAFSPSASFPASEVVALASTRSIGREVSFGDAILKVKALDYYDFAGTDICLMSAGSAVSKEWSPKIAAKGAIVIDNSSHWRMDREVPLVVPEVNADALEGRSRRASSPIPIARPPSWWSR